MIVRYYEFTQEMGIHLYAIPTAIVLAVTLIIGLLHWRKQRKREREFLETEEAGTRAAQAAEEVKEAAVDHAQAAAGNAVEEATEVTEGTEV